MNNLDLPSISLITISFNSAQTIEDTLRSVMAQRYPQLQFIIIDGGSTDGTLELINRYRSGVSVLVSEKDEGIYDAMNKGLALATGEVVGILNSDDFFAADDILLSVGTAFANSGADAVYGDLAYVDRHDPSVIRRFWKAGEYFPGDFKKGWMPPHPAFYVKRKCYTEFGGFNTALKTSADYELMLRFIHKHGIKLFYLPQLLVKMKAGGQSNRSLSNRIKANREDKLAWKLNGIRPGRLTFLLKPLRKLGQFFPK